MKKAYVLIMLVLYVGLAKGQNREIALADTLFSLFDSRPVSLDTNIRELSKYQIDSCLIGLLKNLIKTDKQCSNKIGYYFSTSQTNEKNLIKINPVDLDRVRFGNIFGYFIYCDRIFLCHGETEKFLSKTKISDSLIFKSYISFEPIYNDFYLGGDTNGILKQFKCNDKMLYALIKTCKEQNKVKTKKK